MKMNKIQQQLNGLCPNSLIHVPNLIFSFLLIDSPKTAESICEKLTKSYQSYKKTADVNYPSLTYIELTV